MVAWKSDVLPGMASTITASEQGVFRIYEIVVVMIVASNVEDLYAQKKGSLFCEFTPQVNASCVFYLITLELLTE